MFALKSNQPKKEEKEQEVTIPRIERGPIVVFREYTTLVLGDMGVGKTSLIKNAKECEFNQKHYVYPGKVSVDYIDYLTDKGVVRLKTYEWAGALDKHSWQVTSRDSFPKQPDCCVVVFDMCSRRSWKNVFKHKEKYDEFSGRKDGTEDPMPILVVGTHLYEKYKVVDERLTRICRDQRIPLIYADNPSGDKCDRAFWLIANYLSKRDGFIMANKLTAKWPFTHYDHELAMQFMKEEGHKQGANDPLPDFRCAWPYDDLNSRWFAPPKMNLYETRRDWQ